MLFHASTVALNGRAVLLTGASGVGKSDLALCLMDGGADLVADDQTELSVKGGVLLAAPPANIAGMIEIRHIGLRKTSFVTAVPVALVVDLCGLNVALERLPEPDFIFLLDHRVQRLRLPSFAGSTPAKIRSFLTMQGLDDRNPASFAG